MSVSHQKFDPHKRKRSSDNLEVLESRVSPVWFSPRDKIILETSKHTVI